MAVVQIQPAINFFGTNIPKGSFGSLLFFRPFTSLGFSRISVKESLTSLTMGWQDPQGRLSFAVTKQNQTKKPFNMKSLFILLFSLTMLSANSTPDTNTTVNPEVLESFQKSFQKADHATWSEGEGFFRADFQLNCQYVSAFFSKTGHLLGITRNLAVTQLPVILQANLKSLQNENWISEAFELSNEEGTSYFITVENANERITYRSDKNEWTTYQKKAK
jgi:hypothetical protein